MKNKASDILEREAARIANHEIDPASCLVFKQENTVSAYGRVQNYNISGDADSIHFKSPWSGRTYIDNLFCEIITPAQITLAQKSELECTIKNNVTHLKSGYTLNYIKQTVVNPE